MMREQDVWFQVYEMLVLESTLVQCFLDALNGDGYVKRRNGVMRAGEPKHGMLWTKPSTERLGASPL